jgi:hypothetical protein
MTIRQLFVASASTLFIFTLPCQAGPCSHDIESTQLSIDAKLHAIAAGGPVARESKRAKLHRQVTARSLARAERRLGEIAPDKLEKLKDAMANARRADIDGDKNACEQALADAQRALGP